MNNHNSSTTVIQELSFIIRRLVYLVLGSIDQMLGRKTRHVIYCYHAIDSSWRYSVPRREFEKQIEFLCQEKTPVSLDWIEEYVTRRRVMPDDTFAITFDDGYASVQKCNGVLQKYSVPAAVFILAGNDVDRKSLGTGEPLLTAGEIVSLHRQGWIIGSHGLSHTVLTELTEADIKRELSDSRNTITQLTGKQPRFYAYPKGKYTQTIIAEVIKSGYVMAFSMDDGNLTTHTDVYTVPRVGVDASHSFSEFKVLASPSVISFRNIVKKSPFGKYL